MIATPENRDNDDSSPGLQPPVLLSLEQKSKDSVALKGRFKSISRDLP